jgi:hypothetical protein
VSHVVEIRTEVRDPAACRWLALPVHGTATLFTGEATGLLVRLPGWGYPVVVDTATGAVRFDIGRRQKVQEPRAVKSLKKAKIVALFDERRAYLSQDRHDRRQHPFVPPAASSSAARAMLVHFNPGGPPRVSHIVEIRTEVRDPAAVAAACRRLSLPEPVHGTATLFAGEATGLLVRLPGWLYPVCIDTTTGAVRFDNYHEQWGRQEHLDRLLQRYAVEKAAIEARRRGHTVTEKTLSDGSIRLSIQVGGAT